MLWWLGHAIGAEDFEFDSCAGQSEAFTCGSPPLQRFCVAQAQRDGDEPRLFLHASAYYH